MYSIPFFLRLTKEKQEKLIVLYFKGHWERQRSFVRQAMNQMKNKLELAEMKERNLTTKVDLGGGTERCQNPSGDRGPDSFYTGLKPE